MLRLRDGNRQVQEYTDEQVFTTVYEQDSFVPVARIVQLASHLEQKRLADIAYETRRFVRIGESDVVINQRIADKSQPIIKIYHYHCNHLGTPQELSDDKGDIVWLSYDRAWGESFDKFYKSQFIDNYEILAEQLQPFKFQGQFFDTETSLHYNRFRYYDSDVGMFISRDPIGLLGGLNVFAYAPSPTGWIDPLGLSCMPLRMVNGTNIFGKGQVDSTPGHDQFSEVIANKLAMTGKFKAVYLNRSYNKMVGAGGRRRPDISAIDKNGRVHAIELASITDMRNVDTFNFLTDRNFTCMMRLPKLQRGKIISIPHPYDAKAMKTQLDNLINTIK